MNTQTLTNYVNLLFQIQNQNVLQESDIRISQDYISPMRFILSQFSILEI